MWNQIKKTYYKFKIIFLYFYNLQFCFHCRAFDIDEVNESIYSDSEAVSEPYYPGNKKEIDVNGMDMKFI